MRPVQHFSKEYLEQCRSMTPEQIVRFLDGFRSLHARGPGPKSRLISMKVPEDLLETFKTKARLSGVPYQTLIKRLMREWVRSAGPKTPF